MKKLITILGLLMCASCFATNYYLSAAGNDAGDGLSITTPWQSLAKLNSIFASIKPGDNILFNRGDVFYGSLSINKSGTAAAPITISAYGTGADPVISGFTNVVAWTNMGNNIWESTFPVSGLGSCNMVVINGVNTPMGRYPNSGFLPYQSHSGTTSITSSSFNASTNWGGADLVMRSIQWMLERNPITAQSNGTLTYTGGSSPGTDGFGFFIQNHPKTLDLQNEWYFDKSTKKLRVYSASMPANVMVASIDELVLCTASYINITGMDFIGANTTLYEHRNAKYVSLSGCTFKYSGSNGLLEDGHFSSNAIITVTGSTIDQCNEYAINFGSWYSVHQVDHNTITNTNMIPGSGQTTQNSGDAILLRGPGSVFEFNSVVNSGHHAIDIIQNDKLTVRNNYISGFGMTRYDAGGIYSWNQDSVSTPTGRIIDHNIICNSNQNIEGIGTAAVSLFGIYVDGSSKNTSITNNTIYNVVTAGILILNSGSVSIRDNNVFNNGTQLMLTHAFGGGMPITGLNVRRNNFIAGPGQMTLSFRDDDNNLFNKFGVADSNFYARVSDDNLTISTVVSYTPTNRTLQQWQSFSGQDAHSSKCPKIITDVSDVRFEYNATALDKTVNLDGNYIDVTNASYNGSITLAPWSSAVLIRNGASVPPVPPAPIPASISITDTVKNFNFMPQDVTITCDYPFTITGSPQSKAGAYTVIARINDSAHVGSDTATLIINKLTPALSWPVLPDQPYATLLSAAHLTATSNVPGHFIYNYPVGTKLIANTTVIGTFIPDDTADISGAVISQTIHVLSAPAPPPPPPVVYSATISKISVSTSFYTDKITWITTTENNVNYYLLEKSTTGAFSKLGQITAKGSSSYSYTYNRPVFSRKPTYRITPVFANGTKGSPQSFKKK